MEGDKKPFWKRKTYCLITGASQGIGRQISIQFAKMVAEESTFLLLARNLDNLNETKKMMEEVNSKIHVFVHSFNFYEPISFELHTIINQSLDMFKKEVEDFDLAMIVHNAGSLGDVSEYTYDMKNIEKLTSYFMLNLFSVGILNAEFAKTFDADKRHPDLRPLHKACDICIVNITSLCAVKAFASMGYYCVGKASREMFFKVMAEENPNYLVLNYSPGPVLTDMIDEIIANSRNEDFKQSYIKMKQDSKILSPEESIRKLVQILDLRHFRSGDRIDYYDA